jgi:hypothetical protein
MFLLIIAKVMLVGFPGEQTITGSAWLCREELVPLIVMHMRSLRSQLSKVKFRCT